MEDWLPERVKLLLGALLDTEAQTSPAVRKEIFARAAGPSGTPAGSVPPSLAAHADRVAHTAYKTTDEDLQKLRDEGHSEDVIFEVTLAAAVGAGLRRMRKALSLVRGSGA